MRFRNQVATAALASLAGVGCGSSVTPGANEARAQSTSFTVTPRADTWISVRTLPGASCALFPDEAGVASEPAGGFPLDADDDGVVHFSVRSEGPTEEPVHLVLECSADGTTTTSFPVALRAAETATEDMPLPPPRLTVAPPGSTLRPALGEDEALAMPRDELARRGYPRPPSAAEHPEAYATWLRLIGQPVTMVPPDAPGRHRARRGRAGASTANDYSWSGYVLEAPLPPTGTPHTYDYVEGSWVIPTASAVFPFNQMEYSALWVGLDGYGTQAVTFPSLVQAGTEQDAIVYVYPGRPPLQVHSEFLWTEVVPLQNQIPINVTVSAGDEIYCQVWLGDDSTTKPEPWGAYADFMCQDTTIGYAGVVRTYLGDVVVAGEEADWVMELPFEESTLTPLLADFGSVAMYQTLAGRVDQNPPLVRFNDPQSTSLQITMIGTHNDVRDLVNPIVRKNNPAYGIRFTWEAAR